MTRTLIEIILIIALCVAGYLFFSSKLNLLLSAEEQKWKSKLKAMELSEEGLVMELAEKDMEIRVYKERLIDIGRKDAAIIKDDDIATAIDKFVLDAGPR